jgi:hypothetical protein
MSEIEANKEPSGGAVLIRSTGVRPLGGQKRRKRAGQPLYF